MKLGYLHLYVKVKALAVIKSIPMTKDNYENTWETLKLFHENERKFIHNHLSDLFAVEPMVEDSYEEVKRIVYATFAPLDAPTSLGKPTKYWSNILVHMLVSKMGKECRLDWEG